MVDAKIIAGLLAFGGVVSAPAWLSRGGGPPALAKPAGAQCVEPLATMRATHMELLDRWRNAAVRRGEREYISSDGRVYRISLTGTCIKCHGAAADFCDRCHRYSGVEAGCWDCHPGGAR